MTYKNSEGYPDPTSGKAIKAAGDVYKRQCQGLC